MNELHFELPYTLLLPDEPESRPGSRCERFPFLKMMSYYEYLFD